MASTLIISGGGPQGDGVQIGVAGEKVGFGKTPVTLPIAGAAQAAVATTGATSTTPFGYTEAQANAIVTLVNKLRADLIAAGIIKGEA